MKYVQRCYQPCPNVLPYVVRLSIEECLKYTWSSCWTIALLPDLRTGKSSISKALLQKYSVHESTRSYWLWWPGSLEGLTLLLNNFLQKQWLKALIWRECRSVPIGTRISSIRRDCRNRKQSSSLWHRRRCPMRMFRARERWNSTFLLYRNCVRRRLDERPRRDLGRRAHVLQRTWWRSRRIWQYLRWWWISNEASAAKMFDIRAFVSYVRRYILDRRHGSNSTEDSIHCWLTTIDRVEEDSKVMARRGKKMLSEMEFQQGKPTWGNVEWVRFLARRSWVSAVERINFGFIPREKHFVSRQAEQLLRVIRVMSQSLFKWQRRKFYMTNKSSPSISAEVVTCGCKACRRKNALHDIQLITSKLIPRATSPHIWQISGKLHVRFVKTILEVLIWSRIITEKGEHLWFVLSSVYKCKSEEKVSWTDAQRLSQILHRTLPVIFFVHRDQASFSGLEMSCGDIWMHFFLVWNSKTHENRKSGHFSNQSMAFNTGVSMMISALSLSLDFLFRKITRLKNIWRGSRALVTRHVRELIINSNHLFTVHTDEYGRRLEGIRAQGGKQNYRALSSNGRNADDSHLEKKISFRERMSQTSAESIVRVLCTLVRRSRCGSGICSACRRFFSIRIYSVADRKVTASMNSREWREKSSQLLFPSICFTFD